MNEIDVLQSYKLYVESVYFFFFRFWEEKTEFTPESRIEVHKQMQEQKARDNKE